MARPIAFDLEPGTVLADKYRVRARLGGGWEGEVYQVVERGTGVHRAAKLFYPERNPANRTVRRYARQLEKLRGCPLTIDYHHTEEVEIDDRRATLLLSELARGRPLSSLPRDRRGAQMERFEALHLLHRLAQGLEAMHAAGLYHGDLHDGNVLVERRGIRFELRLFDFFNRGRTTRDAQQGDVIDAVRLLYDCLGGVRTYRSQPEHIRTICCGLKHTLIRRRFPTARHLVQHLENFSWE
ncbi:MAG: serine/threonine protein kinase [Acidobacteria bacterium]|nr:MAG: serine/threonine protein kinase [Acidobacteriota bacterium]REK09164.1 MAG: serine/threonine protein kinase [Acidobacteriota bacterium]